MMKTTLFVCAMTVALLCGRAAMAQKKTGLVGRWQNPAGDGRLEFSQRGGKFYGKLYWLKNPDHPDGSPKLDENNPDPALRTRRIQGIELIHDLVDKGDGVFEDGFVYEPKSAKDFNCMLKVEGDKLELHGFLGIPALGRTELWTRLR